MPVGGERKCLSRGVSGQGGRKGWFAGERGGGGGGGGTGVEAVGKISTAGEGAKKGFQGIEVCF